MERIQIGQSEFYIVHTTKEGFQILVKRGTLSKWDYQIKYRKPDSNSKSGFGRARMPKHIHVIVEFYAKYAKNPKLTLKLKEYFVNLLDKVEPVKEFPPKLIFFNSKRAKDFQELNEFGEFSVEFLMIFEELLMRQEKTNYPKMKFHRKLLTSFADDEVYSVINIATHTGR